VEYLEGAVNAAQAGFLSGGLRNNEEFVRGCVGFADSVGEDYRNLFFDPQTSGGLLVSVGAEFAERALVGFQKHGVHGRVIGEVVAKKSPLIEVV
jgi:selenide, water dikinase